MDLSKWTSSRALRNTAIAISTITIGAIISHFSQNHTLQTIPIESYSPPVITHIDKKHKIVLPRVLLASHHHVVTKANRFKSGIIHHNIDDTARQIGLTKPMIKELNLMFAHEPFKRGDHLNVLYHEYFVNNHRDHPGHIIAAEIGNGRKHLEIVRFQIPHHKPDYFQPNGMSTKPSFLKTPLHYRRIGSHFNYHRFDPVLHRIQPHLGVDLDAPMGTPVKAIANGIVVSARQIRGYGNTIMIKYGKTYKAFYAHLEKYAAHLHSHEHVKKGQVVGYVGSTGYSTGPHLHFMVYQNGHPVNPLTVKFPQGTVIPKKYRRQFLYHTHHLLAELNLFKAASLADNENLRSFKQNS